MKQLGSTANENKVSQRDNCSAADRAKSARVASDFEPGASSSSTGADYKVKVILAVQELQIIS